METTQELQDVGPVCFFMLTINVDVFVPKQMPMTL